MTDQSVQSASLADTARDHLWMHFTRHSTFEPVSEGGLGGNCLLYTSPSPRD